MVRFYVSVLTIPKVLLTAGTADGRAKAAEALSRIYEYAASTHHTRVMIEVLALETLLHAANKNEEAALAALSAEANLPDLQARVVVSDGTAKREVAAIAAEHGCDLVVVGSHGRHAIEAMLGSTAVGVVHRAESDVLVVRAGANA